jgi:hypothetical protein
VEDAGQKALAEWSSRIAARGYEDVLRRYFDSAVQEFFEWDGERYEVTTVAVWDAGREGDLRVIIEVSDASMPPPRRIYERDLILAQPRL